MGVGGCRGVGAHLVPIEVLKLLFETHERLLQGDLELHVPVRPPATPFQSDRTCHGAKDEEEEAKEGQRRGARPAVGALGGAGGGGVSSGSAQVVAAALEGHGGVRDGADAEAQVPRLPIHQRLALFDSWSIRVRSVLD